MTPSDADAEGEIEFELDGLAVLVWKRRVHQWRTDLMIRLDRRDLYLARYEGAMTRGNVKQLAREWMDRRR